MNFLASLSSFSIIHCSGHLLASLVLTLATSFAVLASFWCTSHSSWRTQLMAMLVLFPFKPHILLDHCGLPSLLPPHSRDTASSTPSYSLSLHSGWSVALTLSIWQWKAPAQMKSHLFTISGIDWAALIAYRTKYKSHSHLKPSIMLFWPIEEYSHQTRGFALPQMRQYFPTLLSWLMLFFCLECLAPSHLQPLKYYPAFNVHHKWYPLHKSFLDIFNWMPASLSQPYTFHAHLVLLLTL